MRSRSTAHVDLAISPCLRGVVVRYSRRIEPATVEELRELAKKRYEEVLEGRCAFVTFEWAGRR